MRTSMRCSSDGDALAKTGEEWIVEHPPPAARAERFSERNFWRHESVVASGDAEPDEVVEHGFGCS